MLDKLARANYRQVYSEYNSLYFSLIIREKDYTT